MAPSSPSHIDARRRALLRRLGLSAAASLGAGSLTGCSAPTHPLRVAVNTWIGYALLPMAQELGFLPESEARLIEFPSNTASMLALATGDVEVAALTLDELLLVRDGGLAVQAALVVDESNGADAVMTQPHITSLAGLRGKRIGVETSALGALMLSQVLARADLQAPDVVKVALAADQHVRAFQAREVDAVITYEPYAAQLQTTGAVRLLDTRTMPGLVLDVLTIRHDLQPGQQQQLRRLIQAHFRALAHLQQQPADAMRRIAQRLEISEREAAVAFSGARLFDRATNQRWLNGPQPLLHRTARTVGQVMQAARMIDAAPDLTQFCAAGTLEGAP